jgi:RNA 3'-terminal phosphate cyclase-like protein
LVAESINGSLIGSECMAKGGGDLPEDVGTSAAHQLLVELSKGGCVDRCNQWLVLVLMALGPADVSKMRFGSELTEFSVQALRLIKTFFGVVFKVEKDEESDDGSILVSCVGSGFENVHKLSR